VARLPEKRPLLYYITDRKALHGRDLLPVVERAVAAGIDLIQMRERDLSTRDLLALAEAAVECARGTETRILVNDRLDVALAARGAGVHLPTHGLPVAEVRKHYPKLLIGASTHDLDELRRAGEGGADFVVFGPVYETPSKKKYGAPVGLEALREAAQVAGVPVLALGGLTRENAGECLAAGAAGLAAITLFQTAEDLSPVVAQLRNPARAK
jgi:thiamine-phosphate pyrophosphorylase